MNGRNGNRTFCENRTPYRQAPSSDSCVLGSGVIGLRVVGGVGGELGLWGEWVGEVEGGREVSSTGMGEASDEVVGCASSSLSSVVISCRWTCRDMAY